MLWFLPVFPLLAGAGLWLTDGVTGGRLRRSALGFGAVGTLAVTTALASWAALARPDAAYRFGAGIDLRIGVDTVAAVTSVLVAIVSMVVVAYAAGHEERDGLGRMLGLLVGFAGAMELLVVAEDLLTLLIGWELVGAASWALIGHRWREVDKPAAAAHAFNATRLGDLGLFLAAGAAWAGAESFAYADLGAVSGSMLAVMVAGVLLAATAKSGQVLFAPWLFSAMGGPSSVSALLHSSTMVAAGAYLLIRLHTVLDTVGWFGPATIAIGLTTALTGGVVAAVQSHAKKLLAASTSAHYGFMFVAVGAGYPLVALAHLVVHAVFKAHLFLAAGVAMEAAGSPQLGQMRLGSKLPTTARLSLISALALAALVPLGGAWSKEQVVAAAGHEAIWLAVLVLIAGGLSAVYATRFQVLAFGRTSGDGPTPRTITAVPGRAERVGMWTFAGGSLGLSALWLPPVEHAVEASLPSGLPAGKPWELVASILIAVSAIYATWNADRRGRLASYGLVGSARKASDWLGVPVAVERVAVRPSLALAAASARFDDRFVDAGVHRVGAFGRASSRVLTAADGRVVDAGVRAVAALARWWSRILAEIGERGVDGAVAALVAGIAGAGRDSRRIQTGLTHQYYVIIAAGLVVILTVSAVWR